MIKILVTGGAGYIGSRLVQALLENPANDVTVVDPLLYGVEGLLPALANARLHTRFVAAEAFVPSVPYDICYHLAGIVGEPACAKSPFAAERANLSSVRNLVAQLPKCHHILFSTCSVYGASAGLTMSTEDSEPAPVGAYALARLRAETVVRECNRGTIFRLGTVIGLSARMRFDTLFNEFAYRAAINTPIEIYGPQQWRPFLSIEDLLDALGCFDASPDGVYNLASFNCQKADLGKMAESFGATVTTIPDSSTDPRNYMVATAKFCGAYGWRANSTPALTFRQIVEAVRLMRDPHLSRYQNI